MANFLSFCITTPCLSIVGVHFFSPFHGNKSIFPKCLFSLKATSGLLESMSIKNQESKQRVSLVGVKANYHNSLVLCVTVQFRRRL